MLFCYILCSNSYIILIRRKDILEKEGRKQTWLANKLRITSHMSKVTNGSVIPRLNMAYNIATILGVSVYDIWVRRKDSES